LGSDSFRSGSVGVLINMRRTRSCVTGIISGV
jgi:hypothetical protein